MNRNRGLVTAADVAQRARVDRSTVSRILNRSFDEHRYAPQTIQAVERAARELNYQPSMTGRALRMGRTMVVGLVVGDISNSFFGQLAAAIDTHMRSHQYRLMIGSTREDAAIQAQVLNDMLHRGVDGLIVSPVGTSGMRQVAATKTPMVFVDRPLLELPAPFVGIDNHEAGRQLGEHLRELGYTRVGVVLPDNKADVTLNWRLEGLAAGLGKAATIAWRHVVPLGAEVAKRGLVDRLTASPDGVDVIVGLTNDCTVTALEATRALKLRVPRDIGLTGIDDFRAAELVDPPLTMVAQPIDAIAANAVDYLLDAMRGKPRDEDRLLPPRLILRKSLTSTP